MRRPFGLGLLLTLLLGFGVAACEGPPGAAGSVVALLPDDDTYVVEGETGNAAAMRGTEVLMRVSSEAPRSVALMKFELTQFGGIASARLQVRALRQSATPVTVIVFGTDPDWGSENITFATQPARGPVLGSFVVDTIEDGLYDLDLTAYALSRFSGVEPEVSLAFITSGGNATISSGESAAEQPYLLVTPF